MRREDALTLALKHAPKITPEVRAVIGVPAEWVLSAIQEAYEKGQQKGLYEAREMAERARYKGWKGMGG